MSSETVDVVTDDFVYCIRDLTDRQNMHRYILDTGITYRDDSILVAHTERYRIAVPGDITSGRYVLKVKLFCPASSRTVRLALASERQDEEGFYTISDVQVIDQN